MTAEPQWVLKRMQCTIHHALQSLYEDAEAATVRVNALLPDDAKEFPFEINRLDMQFAVSGYPIGAPRTAKPREKVSVKISGNIIFVASSLARTSDFTILQEWDVRDQNCRLVVDQPGKPMESFSSEQIVQLALEPLFFV